MTTPYEKDIARIASLINVIRRQDLQDIELEISESGEAYYPNPKMLSQLEEMENEMQRVMLEDGFVDFMSPGKKYKALPEFTLEDAEKIIHETTIRWLNNDPHGQDALKKLNTDSVLYNYEDGTYKIFGSASLDQGNGFALKQEFANMMLSDFEFEMGKVKWIEPDYSDISDRTPDQIKNAQDGKQLIVDEMNQQIWNDSSVIRNIDVIYRSAEAALANGYLGQDPEFELAMFNLITGVETDFPRHLLGDGEKTGPDIGDVNEWAANWENTVIENDHQIRKFLISGEVEDEAGNIVSKVANHTENDAKQSLMFLAEHEKSSDRVLDGTALIPQAGNTITEQRIRRMEELMGTWGWDHKKSTANNLTRILSTQGRDPGDKVTFPDGDERYSLRQERDEMAARIDAKMLASTFNEGSDLYNNLLFNLVDKEFGDKYSGYDSRVAQKLAGLNAIEWKLDTRTGMDSAAETVLDHYGLLKNEISEESFNALSKAMGFRDEGNNLIYGSLGEAMNDPTLWATINAARNQKEIEDAAEGRVDINKSSVIQAGILNAARSTGILGPTTSSKFQIHFEKNVLPEIERRIANAGGINNISDIERYVANAVRPGEVFKTYDLNEESYTQHFDPGSPPPMPGMQMPGQPGWANPNTAGTKKYVPPVFDISALTPELEWLAYERPEFAKFLSEQMQSKSYQDAFKEAAAPTFDEEAYADSISGFYEQSVPKWEEHQDLLGKAATAKQAQEAYAIQSAESEIVGGEGEGGLTPFVEQQAQQAYIDQAAADAAAKAESFGKEAFGPPPIGITPEGVEKPMPHLKGDPLAVYDAGFRERVRDQYTTEGMTSEEFFRSRMPGFEERFKSSPFYQQEQERKEREDIAKRRPLLRAGVGTRGLTVFRRRQ